MFKKVKSLGVGLGRGRRRNVHVLAARLRTFKTRLKKFRTLRRVGVDSAKLVRTGGKAAITYGEAIMGVSDSMLRNPRRTVAAAAAPTSGTCGQNLDMALMIADGGPKGRGDPAFYAHDLPISQWALTVWEEWLPRRSLLKIAATAQRL